MKVVLNRLLFENKQTLGAMHVLDDDDNIVYKCKSLELPWLDNKKRISCIPAGVYDVEKRWSEKYKDHFHIKDVPGRTYILIHHGNYNKDTLGCVLVGKNHIDINADGLRDVTSSKATMKKLNELLPDSFQIEIINHYKVV